MNDDLKARQGMYGEGFVPEGGGFSHLHLDGKKLSVGEVREAVLSTNRIEALEAENYQLRKAASIISNTVMRLSVTLAEIDAALEEKP